MVDRKLAYIAGNGISRKAIDLSLVKSKGVLYGCNSIYKELAPDVLIATDADQSHAIQVSGYALDNEFHTRHPYSDKGAHKLKSPYWGWSSGPNAVQLAILQGHTNLYLFGFDFGSVGDTFNNCFADHEFYKKSIEPPTYGGNWMNQITTIISHNAGVYFTIVVGLETRSVSELTKFKNVKIMDIADFVIHINNNNWSVKE